MISSGESIQLPPVKAKILVGTPCYGGMCFVGYVASLMTSKEYLRTKGIQLETCFLTNESLIPRGRNTIVAKFMDDPSFTHLLFIDADITWSHVSIERLVSHDKPLVGALYPKKGYSWEKLEKAKDLIKEPFDAQAQQEVKSRLMNYVVNYTEDRQVVNGLLKVKHIGTGFFLVKRETVQAMMNKYTELKYDDDINILNDSENKWLYALFDCEVHKLGAKTHYLSEDYLFCKRWQDMGGDIYADVTIPLTHTGTHSFVGNFLKSINFEPAQPTTVTTTEPQSSGVALSDVPKSRMAPPPTSTPTMQSMPPLPTPVRVSAPAPAPAPQPSISNENDRMTQLQSQHAKPKRLSPSEIGKMRIQ